MVQHSDLIDKEAVSIDIARAEQWRRQLIQEARKQETLQSSDQFQSVLTWLGVQSHVQEDVLDEHLNQIHPNSCDWISTHRIAKPWVASSLQDRSMWINGNPGAGEHLTKTQRDPEKKTHKI